MNEKRMEMKFDWRVETGGEVWRGGADINLIDEMPKVITRVDRLADHDRG